MTTFKMSPGSKNTDSPGTFRTDSPLGKLGFSPAAKTCPPGWSEAKCAKAKAGVAAKDKAKSDKAASDAGKKDRISKNLKAGAKKGHSQKQKGKPKAYSANNDKSASRYSSHRY